MHAVQINNLRPELFAFISVIIYYYITKKEIRISRVYNLWNKAQDYRTYLLCIIKIRILTQLANTVDVNVYTKHSLA